MQSRPVVTLTVTTTSAEATRALGARLGRLLRAGDLLRLQGDLGAGKTTFVQGVVAGMGGAMRVTSPTFTLVNEYPTLGGLTVHHMDAYRLGLAEINEQTVDTLGLADLLADEGVLLVEWSEHINTLLPAEGVTVRIDYGTGEDERTLFFAATGARAVEILRALQ
jgi:tRNA threonylcarbamoyladenosine biosynthesis protein TsaE